MIALGRPLVGALPTRWQLSISFNSMGGSSFRFLQTSNTVSNVSSSLISGMPSILRVFFLEYCSSSVRRFSRSKFLDLRSHISLSCFFILSSRILICLPISMDTWSSILEWSMDLFRAVFGGLWVPPIETLQSEKGQFDPQTPWWQARFKTVNQLV